MVEHREFSNDEGFAYSNGNIGASPERRQPGEISMGGAAPNASDFSAVPDQMPENQIKPIILSTKRLTLRPPAERDVPTLVELADNEKVARNLGTMPHPYGVDDARYWINVLSKTAPLKRTFAITDRLTDEFMGGCGYRPSADHPRQVEIGYWLGERYWGQGFAAEAAQALIDHAFENEAVDTVWVTVRVTNFQSKRVIEKCGFQFAHNGMSHSLAVGGVVPIDYYSMSRSTWQSLHLWGER